jgi:hypothetical protein
MPPPIPTPFLELVSPVNNADNVRLDLGEIRVYAPTGVGFALVDRSLFRPLVPRQNDRDTDSPRNVVTLGVPHLEAATTYELVYGYSDWKQDEPCFEPELLKVGRFTTKS